MFANAPSRKFDLRHLVSLAATPAVIVFLSSNFVNVGNLAFNMIFSRLMGPELFGVLALLLTIKLALLGVMGAAQMAVSQVVASASREEAPKVEQALSRINRFLFAGLFLLGIPLTASFLLVGTVDARLELPAIHLIVLLLAAVPFGASLSILRGVAFGRMNAGRIALSAIVEMAVRLIGSVLAWSLGFGIEGVVLAISLSIAAGWVVLTDLLPKPRNNGPVKQTARILALSAAPFGLLQLAQVLALDGDIILARSTLPADEAGYIAVLSLFQRIQFFACFALSGVLLPGVVIAVREGRSIFRPAMPIFMLFVAVSVPFLITALVAPVEMIRLLAGADYLEASSGLIFAVSSSVLFTFSYLTATLLIALRDKTGIVILFAAALGQLALMSATQLNSFEELLLIKTACQSATAALLIVYAARRLGRTKLPLFV